MGYYLGCPASSAGTCENPGWYTAYTRTRRRLPQGRLEALLNFQAMVMDLTNVEVANASFWTRYAGRRPWPCCLPHVPPQVKEGRTRFVVDHAVFPQTLNVLRTRAAHLDINLELMAERTCRCGKTGRRVRLLGAVPRRQRRGARLDERNGRPGRGCGCVRHRLDGLLVMKSPGQMGADVVVGGTQRFGVPMGYGGPTRPSPPRSPSNAIFQDASLACQSTASASKLCAWRCRPEQHIRRDKATSNICTARVCSR